MYDALKMHEETKQFEAYLLIQKRIKDECTNGIRKTLLQKLTKLYKTGGNEEDLMKVLRIMKN